MISDSGAPKSLFVSARNTRLRHCLRYRKQRVESTERQHSIMIMNLTVLHSTGLPPKCRRTAVVANMPSVYLICPAECVLCRMDQGSSDQGVNGPPLYGVGGQAIMFNSHFSCTLHLVHFCKDAQRKCDNFLHENAVNFLFKQINDVIGQLANDCIEPK